MILDKKIAVKLDAWLILIYTPDYLRIGKMNKFIMISIIIILLFSSCETIDTQLDSISLGDSYEYVVEELGNPDGMYTNDNGNIVIEYYNYLIDGFSWDRGDFYIEFDKDYKVVGYGAKNVRTGNNPFSYNVTTLI